jgi:hypothetical protein
MVKKNKTKQKKNNGQVKRKSPPFLKTVTAPAAYGSLQSSALKRRYPMTMAVGNTCIVKNYELAGTFPTGAGFQISTIKGNPGLSTPFPWLSNIAKNYQKFRFIHFRAFFSTTTSTVAQGAAFVQIQYDNQDIAPSTLTQVMAGDAAAAGPCWYGGAINEDKAFDKGLNADSNIYVDLDCARLPFQQYYVRQADSGGIGLATHASLTGTGPYPGLGLIDGSYVDQTALPFLVYYGSNGANIGGTPVSAGSLYFSYIVELSEPVASALAV